MKLRYEHRVRPGLIAWANLSHRKSSWHIDMVSVPPECRGSGLGKKILEEVISDADERQVRLSLEAHSCGGLDQAALVAFYERLGFKKNGRRGSFGPVMVRDPR